MGMAVSDIVTSTPSVWGATNAASAAVVFPLAALVAVPLAAVVSDPAQMWHAGERYGGVATGIRSASSEITKTVARHADADDWSERGKDAFISNRVKPYQSALDQAAGMYEDLRDTLRGCATAYTGAGLASAVVGSAVLSYVASILALAVVPGVNATATYVANVRMIEAARVVRHLITGLAKVNGVAGAILARLTAEFGALKVVLPALTAGDAALSGYYIGAKAAPSFESTQSITVNWPRKLPAGAALPPGYRAPSAADNDAIKKIRPESIKALGKDLDIGAAATLGGAYDQAQGNDVGYPGFGFVGIHLAHAHSGMRDHAAEQLAACRDTPGTWLPGLRTSADNWIFADQANVKTTQHGR
jgi:hypothetical protein